MMSTLKIWLQKSPKTASALSIMRLGPDGSTENPLMIQFFTWDSKNDEVSWWKHLEIKIPELAKFGITQVWLPPPNKAMKPRGQGYDAYDLWDLGEFYQKGSIATRWGTKDELVQACSVAKQHHIDILIDAVLNHKLGADRTEVFTAVPVDAKNRLKEIGPIREIKGWTAYDFTGRDGQYSGLRWGQQHFTGIDMDQRTKAKGIYRITGEGHSGWSQNVDKELGNYDYLLGADIDHRNQEVRQDLFAWGPWVLDTSGAAGFRLDAIKHMDRQFILEFIQNVRQRANRKNMFVVSEYWSSKVNLFLPYIKAFQGQTAFFDVPLHDNFHQASKQGPKYDLRKIMDKTLVKIRPDDAVTFVDNHDTQIGQSLESWVDRNFKLQAYALILLRPDGHPCVFYGDLYPNQECYDSTIALELKLLIEIRKKHAYGEIKDYFLQRNCIGFVRMGDSDHQGCAVVLSNGGPKNSDASFMHSIRMHVGLEQGNACYRTYSQPFRHAKITVDGWGLFSCSPNRVEVWIREDGQP